MAAVGVGVKGGADGGGTDGLARLELALRAGGVVVAAPLAGAAGAVCKHNTLEVLEYVRMLSE